MFSCLLLFTRCYPGTHQKPIIILIRIGYLWLNTLLLLQTTLALVVANIFRTKVWTRMNFRFWWNENIENQSYSFLEDVCFGFLYCKLVRMHRFTISMHSSSVMKLKEIIGFHRRILSLIPLCLRVSPRRNSLYETLNGLRRFCPDGNFTDFTSYFIVCASINSVESNP